VAFSGSLHLLHFSLNFDEIRFWNLLIVLLFFKQLELLNECTIITTLDEIIKLSCVCLFWLIVAGKDTISDLMSLDEDASDGLGLDLDSTDLILVFSGLLLLFLEEL